MVQSGVTVTLLGSNGSVVATTTTGSDGSYTFTGLTGDTYKLVETVPSGLLAAKNSAGTAGGSAPVATNAISAIPMTLKAPGYANGFNYDFALVKPALISGFAYVDTNADGVKESGEAGLAGVTITLTGKDDTGATIAPVVVKTDSSAAPTASRTCGPAPTRWPRPSRPATPPRPTPSARPAAAWRPRRPTRSRPSASARACRA